MKYFVRLFLSFVLITSAVTVPQSIQSNIVSQLKGISQRAVVESCTPSGISEIILGFLDTVKSIIKQGLPPIGSLDPIHISELPLELNSELAEGFLNLDNIIFSGLGSFNIPKSNLTVSTSEENHISLKLDLDIDFLLQLNTNYDGDLKLFSLIDLYGKGNIILNVLHLLIDTQLNIRLQFYPFQITIDEGTLINLKLPTIESRITGLLNDDYMSDIIGRQLAETLTFLFESEQPAVNSFFKDLTERLINFINNSSQDALLKGNYNSILEKAGEMLLIEIENILFYVIEKLNVRIVEKK